MKNALKIDKNWKFGYPDLINPDFGQFGYPDFNSAKNVGPGPLNITFGSEMPITLLHLMLMSKIYVVNSDRNPTIANISK